MATRGFDELFFGRPSTPIQYEQVWDLIWPGGTMVVTGFVEFINLAEMQSLTHYRPGTPDQDLFELLTREQG